MHNVPATDETISGISNCKPKWRLLALRLAPGGLLSLSSLQRLASKLEATDPPSYLALLRPIARTDLGGLLIEVSADLGVVINHLGWLGDCALWHLNAIDKPRYSLLDQLAYSVHLQARLEYLVDTGITP